MSRQPTFRLLACLVGLAWLIAPPASATPITVKNASFENHSIVPDEQMVDEWSEDLNPDSIVGHTAVTDEYTGVPAVPDGNSVAILFNSATMSQTLTETLTGVAGSRYDLTVAVGDRVGKQFAGYFIRLFAGTDLLAEVSSGLATSPIPDDGKFTDVSLSYDTTGVESAINEKLKIELAIPALSGFETSFDNVRLDFTSGSQPPPTGVPAPSTVASLMLGLAALGAVRRRRRHGELSGAHFR